MEYEFLLLRKEIEKLGFLISYDWTVKSIRKPFEESLPEAQQLADEMIRAVRQCDIFIVLWAENGTGFHIETGIALATHNRKKHIFVVGAGNDRSLFYFHTSVTRLATTKELILALEKITR